jgi:hypothetical protein
MMKAKERRSAYKGFTNARCYVFYTRCCDGDGDLDDRVFGEEISKMSERARQVTYSTFRKRCVGLPEIERALGYDKHLAMKDDWAVSFHKSKYRRARAFYFDHSRIEHVFVHRDDLALLK